MTVAALALGGAPGTPLATGASAIASGTRAAIVIESYGYHPDVLTVRAGTTLSVLNRDMTQHTLTANDGAFDTGTIQPGATVRITLRKPGTYAYHCEFHAFMTGTIKVVG